MAGLLCALFLSRAGVDYMLIEAGDICRGVTKNTTAKITSQHGLIYDNLTRRFGSEGAKLFFEANESALKEFRVFGADIDCDLENRDAYVYSLHEPKKIEDELRALSRIGAPASFAAALPLPFHFPVAGAVSFPAQAQFNPLKFVAGIAPGLRIFERTRAVEIRGESVLTERGSVKAGKVIVATHFPFINKHGSFFLKMYQHRSYVIALEGGPDVGGMYVDEAERGMSLRNYRDLLLIGGGDHRTGKRGGGWSELEAFAARHYPALPVKYRWATQDCVPLDDLPYIGRYSKNTPNLFVATGFNKWGMTSSMVAAMILSDLARGKENPYSELYSPSRTILRPRLASNAAAALTNLLTPTAPRCPHLGCALKWNPQERSWDCPCHGSRFADDGLLLDNPATGSLKRPGREKGGKD